MQSRAKIVLLAIVAGIGLSALLQVLALLANEQGLAMVTRILDWPNTLLQSFVPCLPIGQPEEQRCEGSPMNLLTYFASLPIGAAVYSTVAYVFFKRRRHVA